MERKGVQEIGKLLDLFLRSNNLSKGYAQYKITQYWGELLGKTIDAATKSLYIKDRILFVKLHSSVIRNELTMMKGEILEKLNEKAGSRIIDDIVIR